MITTTQAIIAAWLKRWKEHNIADPRVYVLYGQSGVGKTHAAIHAADGIIYVYKPTPDESVNEIRKSANNMSFSKHSLILFDADVEPPKDCLTWPNPIVVIVSSPKDLPKWLSNASDVKYIEVSRPTANEKRAFWQERYNTPPDESIIAISKTLSELQFRVSLFKTLPELQFHGIAGDKPNIFATSGLTSSATPTTDILKGLAALRFGGFLSDSVASAQLLWWMFDNVVRSENSLKKAAWADAHIKLINNKYIIAVLNTCTDTDSRFPYSAGLRAKKAEKEEPEEKIKIVTIKGAKKEDLPVKNTPSLLDF